MSDNIVNNKRIAKNTVVLYIRTFITMLVSLYTSRVVLNSLGIENYGIYCVVAGFISMLTILSGSLSSSISRFITYELGKKNSSNLSVLFTTSVLIQVSIAAVVLIVGETLGYYIINSFLQIPASRLDAATWAYHCSLLIFTINLVYVPYNASIIAHERMTAFAYVGILDVFLKLLIAFVISKSEYDKLIVYSILLFFQALLIASIYILYCRKNFNECKLCRKIDRKILKSMTSFAGWAFLTSSASVLNTQGLNMLINIYFGVVLNAARGVASQVEAVVLKFVNDFTTAINPQIIKNYADGNLSAMNVLICRGAKFSYFLLLFLSLPVLFEADILLHWWLGLVPDHTVNFFRLTMVASMLTVLGNTGVTACMASGNIKKYTIILTSIGLLVFPLTILAYELGLPAECCYIIYILIYLVITIVRLFLMKQLVRFPILMYVNKVVFPVVVTTIAAMILPLSSYLFMQAGILRFLLTTVLCILGTVCGVFLLGLSSGERSTIVKAVKNKLLCVRGHY